VHSEYAVEPAAIGADWETFRFLIEKFGFDRGRLISRLPKKWEKKVVQAAKDAGVSDIKLASMVDRLRTAAKLRVVDFGRSYNSECSWLENAVREHTANPFHAIIYAGEERPCAEALCPDDCDDDNVLFSAPISRDIARSAGELADALFILAATAHEIDIVDPFFDLRPANGDFLSPLASLLGKLSASGAAGKVIRIHFRTHDRRPPDNILLRDAPRQTNGIIPPGFVLQLYEWAEVQGGEDFHDRFFLTDTGGLMIGAGLSAGGPAESATFTLLDGGHVQGLRSRFAPNSTVYTRVGSAVQIDPAGNASFI
jgi:hypothetical protein